MERVGSEWRTDWPKLGGALLIATALVVAIRTARWAARPESDPMFSNRNPELDREVSFAVDVTSRVMDALLKRRPAFFPGSQQPIHDGIHDEDLQP